ncbi:MAG TPA: hypothetical protein VG498_04665, partial [Terriglobales bacterium]|nr:hypothetical protein [Terriglobales bacterium]
GNNNNLPIQIGTPVVTDAQGHFLIASAPVGYFKLMADGSTAGSYPTLEYDLNTIAGQDNTVGTPIYLPVLNTANQICIDETHGGTLTLAQYPGFSLAIAPGAATFPGGSRRGCVSVSTVHGDKVPMPPGFGQQPRFIVTIQPVGTTFNPPAAMTLPNVDGLKPRAKTEMYSYDHDLGMFIAIGTATVSDDGSVISSDPGTGVLKAGWHCGGDPNASGHVADCPSCQICSGSKCVPNPKAVPCNDQDNIVLDFSTPQLRDQKVHVVFDNSCKGSACQTESGTCAPNTGGFSIPLLKDGVQSALTKIYDNSATACIGEELRLQMQLNLEQYGIKINCNSDSNAGWCGQAENSQNADGSLSTTHTIDVNTTAMTGKGCAPEPLAAILLHEMLHAYGNDPGAPTLHWHDTVDTTISHPADCRDRVYGCEESCFPGSTARKGVGNPQACRLPQGDVNGKGDPGCNGLCIPFGDVVVCASH